MKDKEKLNNPMKGWQILKDHFFNGFSHCGLVENLVEQRRDMLSNIKIYIFRSLGSHSGHDALHPPGLG